MAYADKEEEKKYKREWYKKNKQSVLRRVRKNNKEYIERNREFVRQLKEVNACTDCR